MFKMIKRRWVPFTTYLGQYRRQKYIYIFFRKKIINRQKKIVRWIQVVDEKIVPKLVQVEKYVIRILRSKTNDNDKTGNNFIILFYYNFIILLLWTFFYFYYCSSLGPNKPKTRDYFLYKQYLPERKKIQGRNVPLVSVLPFWLRH